MITPLLLLLATSEVGAVSTATASARILESQEINFEQLDRRRDDRAIHAQISYFPKPADDEAETRNENRLIEFQ